MKLKNTGNVKMLFVSVNMSTYMSGDSNMVMIIMCTGFKCLDTILVRFSFHGFTSLTNTNTKYI